MYIALQVDTDIDPDKHALVPIGSAGYGGKGVLALPYHYNTRGNTL